MRMLATADVHLGKKFSTFPRVQKELSEARFTCLEGLVEQANRESCDLFVVAGDLFDRVSVPKAEIVRAARAISLFEGRLAAILPGNHDFHSGSGSTLWKTFREACGDRILLLEEPRVYDLGHYELNACLFPGPCDAKHSGRNAISWVDGAAREAGGRPGIGVAHGSVEGLSLDSEGSYFPMTREELRETGVGLWIVGHSHAVYPTPAAPDDSLFIPGCPEPDGFDCRHPGNAWVIDLDGGTPAPRRVSTGVYRFHRETLRFEGDMDPEPMLRRYAGPEFEKTMIRLDLAGRLPRDRLRAARELLAGLTQSLFSFEIGEDRLREAIDAEVIEEEFAAGSFPHRLLHRLLEAGEDEALQAAYELVQETRA